MDEAIKEKKIRAPFNFSSVRLFATVMASIFVVEFGIMLVLQVFIPPIRLLANLVDATSLTIILYPALYFLVFKPLIQKNLEESSEKHALQKSEARLQEAQKIAAVGSWDWDLPTDTHTWSNEESRIFGRDPNLPPATYKEFLAFVHPDDRNRVMEKTEATIKAGVPFEDEFRIIRTDGQERILDACAERFLDANRKPIRLAGTVHDVTEHKKLEKELNEKVGDLERMNKLMIGRELKMVELKEELEKLRGGEHRR